MNALITGITGFAGGFLAEHLLASGDAVLGVSRRAAWPNEASQNVRDTPLVVWSPGDESQPTLATFAAIRDFEPQAIYHLAAMSVPQDCGLEAPTPAALAANVTATARVCELAAVVPSRPKVIFVSTSHVYAPATGENGGPPAPRVESAPLGPHRGYGQSKLAAEQVVLEYVRAGRIAATIARAFQHTGPRQSSRMMLPEWCEQIAAGGVGPIKVHNRDTDVDVSDVRDVVRAYRMLAERGQSGEIYNVGGGTARRTGDILQRLLDLTNCQRAIVETAPGRRYDPIADSSKLQRATGWTPHVALDQTLADTLAWWQARR